MKKYIAICCGEIDGQFHDLGEAKEFVKKTESPEDYEILEIARYYAVNTKIVSFEEKKV